MISPFRRSARATASDVLPDAVGPVITSKSYPESGFIDTLVTIYRLEAIYHKNI
jgi:hypothetical protein